MSIFDTPWSDQTKWVMGIAAAIVVALILAIPRFFGGEVVVAVAEARDGYGRCVDAEVFVENTTNTDALDVVVYFDVDYFTKEGSVELEYNNELGSLITSVTPTLLARRPFIAIEHQYNSEKNAIEIPVLRPGEYLHLFIGAEVPKNAERAGAQKELLKRSDPALMNKPRVIRTTRKDGTVLVQRVTHCAS